LNPERSGLKSEVSQKDEAVIGQLNWSTGKDVQAYLSNRPAVLCFQDIGTERSGLKAGKSGLVWIYISYGVDNGDERE
jgi:hypothetical protein